MINNLEHTIWCEKYRPTSLDTYVGNTHIIDKVKIYLQTGDIPHLLLSGKPGTGKTTLAKIIVNTIDCDSLYINASDENNVDTVRTKIKTFASTVGFRDLKVVILDECDFQTPSSQAALRNIMETFSRTTRFILTCNYVEKIIEPIQSRCQMYNVVPPNRKDIALHVVNILNQEQVKFDISDVATIVNVCYPDIRKVINSCQQQTVAGHLTIDKQSLIEANYMTKLLELLKQHNANKDTRLDAIRQLLADSQARNFDQLYRFLYDNTKEFASGNEASAILIIAESQYEDTLVADKEIGVMRMLIKLVREL